MRRGGSLTTRLAQLERRHRERPAPRTPELGLVEWLAVYERLGAEGAFEHEPDFPKALDLFRAELARARASTEPPFDPPASFKRNHPNESFRVGFWRQEKFPEMRAAERWLGEMLSRFVHDVPPVSEAEFAELSKWFAANEPRLRAAADHHGMLPLSERWRVPEHLGDAMSRKLLGFDMGPGHDEGAVSVDHVRWRLREGPRVQGAGCVAEDVRRLRMRYGTAEARVPAPAAPKKDRRPVRA